PPSELDLDFARRWARRPFLERGDGCGQCDLPTVGSAVPLRSSHSASLQHSERILFSPRESCNLRHVVARRGGTPMTRRSPVESNHVLPSRQLSEPPVTSPSEEPAWKQRAVERSIKTAKLRAAQRVQRFLDAAQAIIIEKGSTDFTVQEVVDRSRQSLR